jgi:alpha-L-glutamate ligase-like protein
MGILGLNRRNADYTLMHNPRNLYPLVDDKLRTKQIAVEAGLAVPELYAVVKTEHEIRDLHDQLEARPDFAVKPSRGSGGNGILVVSGRSRRMYRKLDGLSIDRGELAYHISNILSGMHSLGGHPDRAMVEYRVKPDPIFNEIVYQGVPDIRIIVFLGVPVMSMVRLPTRMSDGKANLHQGAVGAGIDIAAGRTLTAVWRDNLIREHPDTGGEITGLQIPNWEELLRLAARCHELTGLGYLGVDIVLDRDKGPMILELNARPGLNIQIANRSGLLPRLKKVEECNQKLGGFEERVEFARTNFAHECDSHDSF